MGKVLFILLCFFFFCSCDFLSNRNVLLEKTERILSSKITFYEDSLFKSKIMKLLILVPDTGECAKCQMMVYHWKMYKEDLNERNIECDFIYLLNDSLNLDESTLSLIKSVGMNSSNGLLKLYELNKDVPLKVFDAYLVDKDNRIRLVGNPVQNIDLWSLYRTKMKELDSICEIEKILN